MNSQWAHQKGRFGITPLFPRFHRLPGERATRPGEAACLSTPPPRSPSRASAPVLSPGVTARAAVRGGRGSGERARTVRWRSGEPVSHGAW